MNILYVEYLKRTYEKANAAWRKRQRDGYQSCQVCSTDPAQITIVFGPAGIVPAWLCRPHRDQWQLSLPNLPYDERLRRMDVKFLTEAEWVKSNKEKRKYRPKPCMVLPVYEGTIMVGIAGTAIPGERAREAAAKRKNAPTKSKPLAVIKPMKAAFKPEAAAPVKRQPKSTLLGSVLRKKD